MAADPGDPRSRAVVDLPDWTGLAGLLDLRTRVLAWIEVTSWVRAAALFGSTERSDRPADDWSDLDVLLVVDDPIAVAVDADWPAAVGEPWISLVHDAPIPGVQVRQVLYAPGHDVDWVSVSWPVLASLDVAALEEIAGQGTRIVRDPDGRLESILPRSASDRAGLPPADRATVEWTIDDLLYQCVWTVKRLRRGELWRAKDDVDRYLKAHLLTLLGWQALARDPHAVVFPEGRAMRRWAVPASLEMLPGTFATFDQVDIGRAVLATLELARDLGREVGAAVGWVYPEARHTIVEAWVRARLAESDPAGSA
jgi:aminoglycoside 6-adenylyltransferase